MSIFHFKNRSITYIYDAMGTKLHKIVNDNGNVQNTWYLNGFQYNDNGLEFFATEEGRVVRDVPFGTSGQNGQFRYEYSYKDHLGNLRLTFSDLNFDNSIDKTTEVLQEVNYYPFGLEHSYAADDLPPLSGAENQYKFNGKEKQTEFGLNWLDYGARMYDAAVGRWNGIDALSEKYLAISPYIFVANNPINLKDIGGAAIVGIRGKELVKIDGNKITFTKAGNSKINSGAKAVLQAMMKTPKGKEIIRKLQGSDTKTDIQINKNKNQGEYYYIDNDGNIRLIYGGTSCGGSIEIDDNGNPYIEFATISINENSFELAQGKSKELLPRFDQGKEIVSKDSREPYSNLESFYNGVGVHEGTHVLNDVFDAMSSLGIDKLSLKGKAARKLFTAIRKEINHPTSTTKENLPNENEQQSRSEL